MFHCSVITAATLGTGGKRAGWMADEGLGGEGEAVPSSTPQSSAETPDEHSVCLDHQRKPPGGNGLDTWSFLYLSQKETL